MTEGSGALQQKINEFCHSRNICFISSSTPGLCGRVFCDFGEKFVVLDTNGEQPKSFMIASITKVTLCRVGVMLPCYGDDGHTIKCLQVIAVLERSVPYCFSLCLLFVRVVGFRWSGDQFATAWTRGWRFCDVHRS